MRYLLISTPEDEFLLKEGGCFRIRLQEGHYDEQGNGCPWTVYLAMPGHTGEAIIDSFDSVEDARAFKRLLAESLLRTGQVFTETLCKALEIHGWIANPKPPANDEEPAEADSEEIEGWRPDGTPVRVP